MPALAFGSLVINTSGTPPPRGGSKLLFEGYRELIKARLVCFSLGEGGSQHENQKQEGRRDIILRAASKVWGLANCGDRHTPQLLQHLWPQEQWSPVAFFVRSSQHVPLPRPPFMNLCGCCCWVFHSTRHHSRSESEPIL